MRRILVVGLMLSCAGAQAVGLKVVVEGFTSPTVLIPLADDSGLCVDALDGAPGS